VRIVNRLAAILLALVLLAIGLYAVVQTVSGLLGRPWPVTLAGRGALANIHLSDRRVLVTSIVVGLVGLVMLVAQLVPRPRRRLPAAAIGPDWWVRRRSVERRSAVAAAVGGGAQHSKASVDGDANRWKVRVTGEAPPDRQPAVERAVRTELATLGAPPDVTVTASLRQPGRVR
jgi:hypothetical protein